jgi:hypothetical protein
LSFKISIVLYWSFRLVFASIAMCDKH